MRNINHERNKTKYYYEEDDVNITPFKPIIN